MPKVKDVLQPNSKIKINPLSAEEIDQDKLWSHYDPVADSLVVYFTGVPTRAVSVQMEDDIYFKVDPATGDIVGFHIEAWERKFIPTHPEIQSLIYSFLQTTT